MRAIREASQSLPESVFVCRNGKYHYALQSRVFVDAPQEIAEEMERSMRKYLSEHGTHGGFIRDMWPGVHTIVEGDCYADDCIIFENVKAFYGSVYVDE